MKITLLTLILCTLFAGCNLFNPGKNVKLSIGLKLDEFVRDLSNDPDDSELNKALGDATTAHQLTGKGFVSQFADIFEKENPGASLAKLFAKPTQAAFSSDASNGAVVAALSTQALAAMRRTADVLKARLSSISNRKVKLELYEQDGVIKAELRTEYALDRLASYVQTVGHLQFYETYTNTEFIDTWMKINDTLVAMQAGGCLTGIPGVKKQPEKSADAGDGAGLDQYAVKDNKAEKDTASEADKHPLFTILQPYVDKKTGAVVPGPVVGFIMARDIPALFKILAVKRIKSAMRGDVKICPGAGAEKSNSQVASLYALKVPANAADILDGSCH